jgi:hypothetical protein
MLVTLQIESFVLHLQGCDCLPIQPNKMSRKLNAKEMAEREEFEQVEELFDMLIELYDPIKCKSVYNGMLAASQVQFLNYCKDLDNIYTFYAYL